MINELMKVMSVMENRGFIKQAFAYASFVGKVQGLFQFVNDNPDYYSAEEIAKRVNEITFEMEYELKDVTEDFNKREQEKELEEFHSHLGRY